MSTIHDTFMQAQLAEAAYADFSDATKSDFDALTTGNSKLSASQAANFLNHWQILDQYTAPNSDLHRGVRSCINAYFPLPYSFVSRAVLGYENRTED